VYSRGVFGVASERASTAPFGVFSSTDCKLGRFRADLPDLPETDVGVEGGIEVIVKVIFLQK